MSPITSPSAAPADALNGAGKCGNVPAGSTAYPDRCGYGPRQPLLVVSPYAKANYVDHALTDQTSVLKFIEDNWQLGRIGDQSFDARAGSIGNMFDFNPDAKRAPKVFLDPETGLVVKTPPPSRDARRRPHTDAGDLGLGRRRPSAAPSGTASAAPAAEAPRRTTTSGTPAKLKLACTTKRATQGGQRHVHRDGRRRQEQGHRRAAAARQGLVDPRDDAHDAQERPRQGDAEAAKQALKKGKYTLRIAVTHKGGVLGMSQHGVTREAAGAGPGGHGAFSTARYRARHGRRRRTRRGTPVLDRRAVRRARRRRHVSSSATASATARTRIDETVVARSADGEHLRDGVHARPGPLRRAVDRAARARARHAGGWRMYVSCATPHTKHWWIGVLDAPTLDGLAVAPVRTAFAGDAQTAVKDPIVRAASTASGRPGSAATCSTSPAPRTA